MEIADFWFDLGFSNPSENAQRVENSLYRSFLEVWIHSRRAYMEKMRKKGHSYEVSEEVIRDRKVV